MKGIENTEEYFNDRNPSEFLALNRKKWKMLMSKGVHFAETLTMERTPACCKNLTRFETVEVRRGVFSSEQLISFYSQNALDF